MPSSWHILSFVVILVALVLSVVVDFAGIDVVNGENWVEKLFLFLFSFPNSFIRCCVRRWLNAGVKLETTCNIGFVFKQ